MYYKALRTVERYILRRIPGFKEVLAKTIGMIEKYISVKTINKCKVIPGLMLITIFIYES